ncbi:MAG: class I SAM-dependent RNA methyltransferase, partial [Candidatus Marinimicrobia bacterium]|nr:class I SAM-dependent RNA methyltransferase [Candidatus Neomarinimicrobiota bacterium]
MSPPVRKYQELELTIENLAFGGKGIVHVDDYIIFIPMGAVPGQVVKARITKATTNYSEAKVLEIIRKSDNEIIPLCPYFGQCGGCKHQNLQYEEQLRQLHNQVKELYYHLGGFKETVVNSPVSSDKIFRYRNKMEFAFSNRRWLIDSLDEEKPKDFALGLRAQGNYWKAIDIDDCIIAPEESGILLSSGRNFALRNKISAYDQKSHEGFLRHLVIRKGQKTDQLMLNIVTNSDSPELLMPL